MATRRASPDADREARTAKLGASPLVASVLVSVSGATPAIVVPALYPRIVLDLPSFSLALLGLTTTLFFALSSVVAPVAGRVADRIGAAAGIRLVAAASVAVIAIASLAPSAGWIFAAMGLGGLVHGFGLTVSSLALSAVLDGRSPATQFGIKQSSIPLVSLLGGAALSLAAVAGWRVLLGAFLLFPLAAFMMRPSVPPPVERPSGTRPGRVLDARLAWFLVIAALAGLGVSSLATYGVVTLIDTGWSEGAAGMFYGVAAVTSLVSRVLAGFAADRRGSSVPLVGWLLLAGASGFALLSSGVPVGALVGVLLAYGLGWSYTGLMMFSVAEAFPGSVGRATGWLQAGAAIGISGGPALFSVVQSWRSPGAAWATLAVTSAVAGVLAFVAAGRIARPRPDDAAVDEARSARPS